VCEIDSVAALVPKGELEGEMGDSKMGLHARLMSQACRKMVGTIAKTNTLCIFINQIRNKIGVTYGSPEVTTGGLALQFYSSVRLSVTRSTTQENSVMNGAVKEGNQTTVKVIKNKCAPPFRSAKFNIIYGKGVDRLGEVVDLAIEIGVIKQAGSWFSYNGDKLGQGKDSVRQLLADNQELYKEIESKM
jgi:recombination protein RecA